MAIAALLTLAGSASAIPVSSGVALNATDVVAVTAEGCAPGAFRLATSQDRGVTWSYEPAAACTSSSTQGAAPFYASGRYEEYALMSPGWPERPFLVSRTLARTALPNGASLVVGAGDHVYNVSNRVYRLTDDLSTWGPCGALPTPDTSWSPGSLFPSGSGLYIVASKSGSASHLYRSTDQCATWIEIAPPADCSPNWITPEPHGVVLTCNGSLSDRWWSADGASWTKNDAPVGYLHVGPHTLGTLPDTFSIPWDLLTWPTSLSPHSDPPPADVSPLVEWINVRFRRPMGLPDLAWDAPSARAAANHATYWDLNGGLAAAAGAGLGAHNEAPTGVGFTGATPGERCLAAGASCNSEDAFPGFQLSAAVPGWLNTPFHGAPFLAATSFGMAASRSISVANFTLPMDQPLLVDLLAAGNTPTAPLRLWPADGLTDVPTSWSGGELPDPLANYAGDRSDVGPTLFLMAFRAPIQVTLSDGAGQVPLFAPYDRGASTVLHLGSVNSIPMYPLTAFPARRLRPESTYRLSVTDAEGRTATTQFRTIAETRPPTTSKNPPRRCRLAVSRGRTTRKVRRINFRTVGCPRGSRVWVRVKAARKYRRLALRPRLSARVGTQMTAQVRLGRRVILRRALRA